MKNIEIINMYENLNELLKDSSIKLPAKAAFAIIHNIKALSSIVQEVEEARVHTIKKYGQEIAGEIRVPDNQQDKANEELAALANMEVEIKLVKVNMQDIENLNISLQTAQALSYMIEEEI